MRYQLNDNFLWEPWHKKLEKEIVELLESRHAKKDEDQIHEIDNYNFDEISAEKFFHEYVKLGRPVIIRKVPTKANKLWTAEYIKNKVGGNYSTVMRCGWNLKTLSISQYLNSKLEPNATSCYLDNNSNIFLDHPALEAELELERFSPYASNKPTVAGKVPPGYLLSQLFMGIFPSLGVQFHCANYNNLFFMVQGRKRWTFVDPAHSFFLYPTFPRLMRNSISRLTWNAVHAENSKELIAKHYPLYRYAPKYQFVLEPGDMLYNPSWNWHMVENLDDESIGVATRW